MKKYLVAYNYRVNLKNYIENLFICMDEDIFTETGIRNAERIICREKDIVQCDIINIFPLDRGKKEHGYKEVNNNITISLTQEQADLVLMVITSYLDNLDEQIQKAANNKNTERITFLANRKNQLRDVNTQLLEVGATI